MNVDRRHSLIQSLLAIVVFNNCASSQAQPPSKSVQIRTVTIPPPDAKSANSYFEPHIAVDPENSERLVLAAMFCGRIGDGDDARGDSHLFVLRSENGGRTWSEPIAPFENSARRPGRIGADPVVAVATAGVGWLVGNDYDFPVMGRAAYQSVKISRSEDGGTKWNSPITIVELDNDKNGKGVVDKPWLAIDAGPGKRRGTTYVTWSQLNYDNKRCELWCAALPPGGVRFTPKVALGEPIDLKASTNLIHHVQLAVRADGTIDAVWRIAPTNRIVHAFSSDGARSFSKPTPIAGDEMNGIGQFPSLAPCPDGGLLTAWVNHGNVFCSVFAAGHWSAPSGLDDDRAAKSRLSHPAVAATDALWVLVYREEESPKRLSVVLCRSEDQGKKWNEFQVLATRTSSSGKEYNFNPGHYFGLAAANGSIYAAYILPGEGSEAGRSQLYVTAIRATKKR